MGPVSTPHQRCYLTARTSEQVWRQVGKEQTGPQAEAEALDDLASAASLVVAEPVAERGADAALHVGPISGLSLLTSDIHRRGRGIPGGHTARHVAATPFAERELRA